MRRRGEALRARQAALRRELERLRAGAWARRGRGGGDARRRRAGRLVALLALLAALFLYRCSCDVEPVTPAPTPGAVLVRAPLPAPPRLPPSRPADQGRLARLPRAVLEAEPTPRRAWLDDFRLQVAARSVRLAGCFLGAERPGALRWTCAVDPTSGVVSDQGLAPVGAATLLTEQRDCLSEALARPPYRLQVSDGAPSTPARVGMVIEF